MQVPKKQMMNHKINAFTEDALGKMDAVGIAEAIAKKEISVSEAIEAAIARAEKVNPELNAIVVKTYEKARSFSEKTKGSGLFGVPTFIKDTDHLAGYPTQMGTGAFKSKNATHNSKFVNQFLSTGLVNLGKSTLPEFGLICSTENQKWGITRNPWNTEFTTGGSSSGSAALVASGVVPIASANDGAGSIRIPAAICGLVGLKPSRFRLFGVDGGELMPVQIVHQGVLTRSVRDTAKFFAEAEKYHIHPKLSKMGYVQNASKKRLRIAFVENLPFGKTGHQDEDTYRTQLETAKLLESLGHSVKQIPLPIDVDKMAGHFLNYYGFMSYMLAYWSIFTLKAQVNRKELEPFTLGLSKRFQTNAFQLPLSLIEMHKMVKLTEKLFSEYDVLMTPMLAHKTPKIGYFSPELSYEDVSKRAVDFAAYCGLHNVSGVPAMSLPLGIDSNEMPIGVQLIAGYGKDKTLLELAYELEEAKPFRRLCD
jgi:amidase